MKVWIDEGCNCCGACQDICPDVFMVDDEGCYVSEDNIEGNEEYIIEAADECPVEVIILEEDDDDDEDDFDLDDDDDDEDEDEEEEEEDER